MAARTRAIARSALVVAWLAWLLIGESLAQASYGSVVDAAVDDDEEPWLDESDEPRNLLADVRSDAEERRLSAEHDDVPTDVEPISEDVRRDWEHDFAILKRVLGKRGYDNQSAGRLCELPRVYCNTGYRRRIPYYASKVMEEDWVGKSYQLLLGIRDGSKLNVVDEEIALLKRVSYLDIDVNAGLMPQGMSRLPELGLFAVHGTGSLGLEGELPEDFWSVRARMFSLGMMGEDFTGQLPKRVPMCDSLTYRIYLYKMPKFYGDISGLADCKHVVDSIQVYSTPGIVGNAWLTLLNWNCTNINLWGAGFAGLIPYARTSEEEEDPWKAFCDKYYYTRRKVLFRLVQRVGGILPRGLSHCFDVFADFDVRGSQLSGRFPINFFNSQVMGGGGIKISDNRFVGPIPDVPLNTYRIDFSGNQWDLPIPRSWQFARNLHFVDLSNCGLEGELRGLPSSILHLNVSRNKISTIHADGWMENLLEMDVSDNALTNLMFATWRGETPMKMVSFYMNKNPITLPVSYALGVLSDMQRLKNLDASNCSLFGHAAYRELSAHGKTSTGVVSFDSLEMLDLSHNNVESFGFDNFEGSSGFCWSRSAWFDTFPQLRTLSLEGSEALRSVHPEAFTLNTLDVRNCASLGGYPLVPAKHECFSVFESEASTCEGEQFKWPVCLYADGPFTQVGDDGLECQNVRVWSAEGRTDPQVLMTPQLPVGGVGQPVSCRCPEGYELEGQRCKEAPIVELADAGGGVAESNVLLITLSSAGSAMLLAAVVFLVVFRRRRAALAQKRKKQEELQEQQDQQQQNTTSSPIPTHTPTPSPVQTNTPPSQKLYRERKKKQQRGKRRQPADGAAAAADDGEDEEDPGEMPSQMDVANIIGAQQSQNEDQATTEMETSRLFSDMQLADIFEQGSREHWIIMPHQIEFVQSRTASGAFGDVVRGMLLSSTEVAVKIPRNATSVQSSQARALANEMRLLRRIRHPNCVLFHGMTVTKVRGEPMMSLVLEWVNGGDYGGFVRQRRRNGYWDKDLRKAEQEPPMSFFAEHIILIDVSRGMLYLHGQDPPIIHRDLKPGNILIELSEPPRAKIADFGMSVLMTTNDLTHKAGTLSYMAPEVTNRQAYGTKADVYSFGCVCLFSLTAKQPAPWRVQMDLERVAKEVHQLSGIADVAQSCLHTDPKERIDFYDAFTILKADENTRDCTGTGVSTGSVGTKSKSRSVQRTSL